MGKIIDLANTKFGRLLALNTFERRKRYIYWLCKCDCGNEKYIRSDHLRYGKITSCGCFEKEARKEGNHTTHGLSKTRIFKIFQGMKKRCYNPECVAYSNYGGRGIKICDEWLNNYTSFHDWALSNGYADNLSIDRIDVNGNYEPSNCRWVDAKTQANNRRPRKDKAKEKNVRRKI
ncbi:MAG: hypothetical protein D8H99_49175 [Streptococcus sp.]|nr:MAG: hypothetical protein D8H99_49175 [Streptococcus sp.]